MERHAWGASIRRLARSGVRSRRVLALFAVLVAGLVLTACFPNGEFPDNTLTTVSPTCRVVNEVAPHLESMLADAHTAGLALAPESQSYSFVAPPSIESCYRSYAGQVWWRNYYCFFGNCALAAVPGTSVHGWGRAVDFECAGHEMTFDDPCYAWLQSHAANYGFVHPAWAEPGQASSEAWHWEAT